MLCTPIRHLSRFALCLTVGVLLGYAFSWNLVLIYRSERAQNASATIATDMGFGLNSSNSLVRPIDITKYCTEHGGRISNDVNRTNVKIVCMVFTVIPTNVNKAKTVEMTWGRRCDSIFFVASNTYPGLPTVVMPPNIEESRGRLWEKTKFGFSSAYSNYFEDADWFLKADDDTYVVLDNLRSLLHRYNGSKTAYYLGFQLKDSRGKRPYMSGGAGYVLSKRALEMFIENGLNSKSCNKGVTSAEDVNMGYCLDMLGVNVIDSRDIFGRERFLPIVPFKFTAFVPGHTEHDFWYWRVSQNRQNEWYECGAESMISFHYASPEDMRITEFFLYHLAPYRHYLCDIS